MAILKEIKQSGYFIVATKSNKKSPCSYCRGFLKSSASFE
jgi:hypothetical protein